jgi:Tol biopolymer transport system component
VPRLAADGRTVIFRSQSTRETYVADVSNIAEARRVLSDAALPVISPDGQNIVIGSLGTSRRADRAEVLYLVRGDGTGEPELIANPGRAPEQWTQPDLFTFITYKEPQNYDLWVYSLSRRQAQPIAVQEGSAQLSGAFSPNGKWISYQSTEVDGQWQIFLQPYPTDGRTFQVTTDGGRSAAWASDSELIYDGDGRMYSVAVDVTGATPQFGRPRELPITGMVQPQLRRNWDITRVSGEPRLLMQFQAGPQLNVVPGWTARVRPTAGN